QGFYLDRAYSLFMGVVHDLPGQFVIDILHPPVFLAFALFDGSFLLGLLQLLATSIEATAHLPLIATIAKEKASLPTDIGHSRYLDAQINPHHAVLLYWFRLLNGHRDIGHPLPPLLLDTQDARSAIKFHISTRNLDLLRLAIQTDWQGEHTLLKMPVLVIPLTDGFFQDRQAIQVQGSFKDRTRIPQGLIFDARRKVCHKVLGAEGAI